MQQLRQRRARGVATDAMALAQLQFGRQQAAYRVVAAFDAGLQQVAKDGVAGLAGALCGHRYDPCQSVRAISRQACSKAIAVAWVGDPDQRPGAGMDIQVTQVGDAVLADDAVRIDPGQAHRPGWQHRHNPAFPPSACRPEAR